jgi:hypothetical protein
MVWNGPPGEWRLSVECHGRSEWNDAAAALRLRWQSPRPSLEIKAALIARMMHPPGRVAAPGIRRGKSWKRGVLRRIYSRSAA